MTQEQIEKRKKFIEETMKLFKEFIEHIEPVKNAIMFLDTGEKDKKKGLYIDIDKLDEHFKQTK